MNRIGFAFSILMIVGIAAWAYHVNYRTKTALGRIDTLRAEIAAEREALQVAEVEWAYLNAPIRLARLARQHQDVLGLAPLDPTHFDQVAAMPFAPEDPADLAATVVATNVAPPDLPPTGDAAPQTVLARAEPAAPIPPAPGPATPAAARPSVAKAPAKPAPSATAATAATKAQPVPPRAAKPQKPARIEVAPARIAEASPIPAPVDVESTGGQVESLSDSDLLDVLSEVADTIARSANQPVDPNWGSGSRNND